MSTTCTRKRRCCSRKWVSLSPAHARTIHKFQGQTAGPVDPGKPPNQYEVLMCDPDERRYESTCMGLLYTAISRATTLGDESGRGSAIYFFGSHFDESRFRNIGKKNGSTHDYEAIQKREKWVKYLKQGHVPISQLSRNQRTALKWAHEETYTYNFLYDRISDYIEANRLRDPTTF